VRIVWSVTALCEALRRLGFSKLDRPLSQWMQFRKVGWHVLVDWRRSDHPLNPPLYLELLIHFDKPHNLVSGFESHPSPICQGDEVEALFNMISLMYSRVILDWALEERGQENEFFKKVARQQSRQIRPRF